MLGLGSRADTGVEDLEISQDSFRLQVMTRKTPSGMEELPLQHIYGL